MGEEISNNEEIKAIEIIEHIKDLFNDEQENSITRTIRKHERNIKKTIIKLEILYYTLL